MAWFTEQLLADFLNKCEVFSLLKKQFSDILSEDVVLYYGASIYEGREKVLDFFEGTANAISSEFGFCAAPVIICNTEDAEYNMVADKKYKAVALFSKLEEYVSWFFMIKCNENFMINVIRATQGMGYKYYNDLYKKGEYKHEEP